MSITKEIKNLLDIKEVQARIEVGYMRRGIYDCWPWFLAESNGYGKISIGNKSISVHRAIAYYENGLDIDGKEVHHICGHRDCCNPSHIQIKVHVSTPRKHGEWIRIYGEIVPDLHQYDRYYVWVNGGGFAATKAKPSHHHKEPIHTPIESCLKVQDNVILHVRKNFLYQLRDNGKGEWREKLIAIAEDV